MGDISLFLLRPLILLSSQTGQVLEKGSVLQLHNLKREAGGGYLCMASVPIVPGLNRTQLVNVAVFGEVLWAGHPESSGFELFEAKLLCCGNSGGEAGAGWPSFLTLPCPLRAPVDGLKGKEGTGERECSAESVL
jgi:hypothetical protein